MHPETPFSHLLHLTAHAWRQAIARRLKETGLGMSSWLAVSTLAASDAPLTQKALAERLGLEGPSVVSLVNRLVSQGWLQRVQPAEDRRKRLLVVTPAGMALWQRVKCEADDLRGEWLGNIDRHELAVTHRVLVQLLERAEAL
ncbi:MarR family winged helix-turn-helix transcriptional regulator [Pantoea sp. 1.19]|uniref:MarR family winged helix-turn-helix transcriptional regulator n=1 Tax=Pantoea sp. 1.19 TaxID=1925589 RepID=UPI000948CE02|nr:MarR family transcriptional regulator [Pantoea sp. 1.19]